jgi:thymidylate synthase
MYSAVIVEPRCHNALQFVLTNFLENLDDNWTIIIFHGILNHTFVKKIIKNHLLHYVNRIRLVNLNVENITIDEYNILLKSEHFYDFIPSETFLLFQTDTLIFKENKQLIHLFMEYDYVGAPWEYVFIENERVGNGGLSLRKKSKMMEIINKNPPNVELNEDAYFCYQPNINIYKPSLEKAKLFAVEQIYSEITWGCHKPWLWDNYYLLCSKYPEVETLKNLQETQPPELNHPFAQYAKYIVLEGLIECNYNDSSIVENPHEEYQYIDLIKKIIDHGLKEPTRNGITLSIFGYSMKYSLLDGNLPLFTTKKVAWKACFEELRWFIRGSTDNQELIDQNVHIWDANASREFLDSQHLYKYEENDLGPIYGHQWRHYDASYVNCKEDYTNKGIDQLQNIINQLKDPDPQKRNSRRLVLCAWNPKQIPEMALPPCHILVQFNVSENKYLSCALYQRSGDVGLGIPFNVASYSFLTHILAKHCNLVAKEFVHFIGNAHIYEEHVEALKPQIQRTPYPFPKITIKTQHEHIEDYSLEDIEFIEKYQCHPPIKMDMIA